MNQYSCPICNKRACDSTKMLRLAKLSKTNERKADVVIKCQNCKSSLAIKVNKDTFAAEQMNLRGEVMS